MKEKMRGGGKGKERGGKGRDWKGRGGKYTSGKKKGKARTGIKVKEKMERENWIVQCAVYFQ